MFFCSAPLVIFSVLWFSFYLVFRIWSSSFDSWALDSWTKSYPKHLVSLGLKGHFHCFSLHKVVQLSVQTNHLGLGKSQCVSIGNPWMCLHSNKYFIVLFKGQGLEKWPFDILALFGLCSGFKCPRIKWLLITVLQTWVTVIQILVKSQLSGTDIFILILVTRHL